MEINEIKNPQDVYKFMTDNIEYGWIDINGNKHLNTMKEFRKVYRTMSIEEILKYKIGTCIDQVNLIHYLLVLDSKNLINI